MMFFRFVFNDLDLCDIELEMKLESVQVANEIYREQVHDLQRKLTESSVVASCKSRSRWAVNGLATGLTLSALLYLQLRLTCKQT